MLAATTNIGFGGRASVHGGNRLANTITQESHLLLQLTTIVELSQFVIPHVEASTKSGGDWLRRFNPREESHDVSFRQFTGLLRTEASN